MTNCDTKFHGRHNSRRFAGFAELGRRVHWLTKFVCVAVPLISAPLPALASNVRVFVLAPDPSQPLASIETHGANKPLFSHAFSIPYASLQSMAQAAAENALTKLKLSGTEPCPSICPDVHWRVDVKPTITFVDKAAPIITAFGNPQENGVDVRLKTRVRLQLNGSATLSATAFGKDHSVTTPIAIDLLVELDGASKLNLWPNILAQITPCDVTKDPVFVCAKATLVHSNVDLRDLHGATIVAGAVLGSTVVSGFTGDLFSGLVLALSGAKGAESAARSYVNQQVATAVNDLLKQASELASKAGSDYLNTETIKADAIKQKLLGIKIPSINKSLQDLSAEMGLTLDVQTTTSSNDVNVIVTPRFAALGTRTVTGKLRLPKDACTYMTAKSATEDITFPTGMASWNTDLESKVGQYCTGIFPGSQMAATGYLGADPMSAKAGGNSLPNWKKLGNVNFTGTLISRPHSAFGRSQGGGKFTPSGYYECGFEITNVSPTAIFQLALPPSTFEKRMAERYEESRQTRHVWAELGGMNILLDANWKPEAGGLIIGGEGKCVAPRTHFHQYGPSLMDELAQALQGFDPDKCAVCGIQLQNGRAMITGVDPAVQSNSALRNVYDAFRTGRPLTAPGAIRSRTPTIKQQIELGPRAPVSRPRVRSIPQEAPTSGQ